MSKLLKIFLMIAVISACSEKKNTDPLTVVKQDGGEVVYQAELAQTHEELSNGLMNRATLAANSGMIFDLSNVPAPTAMWMKDTKIPLDMLFIDKDGTIFWIYENAEPDSTKMIVAPYPAAAVLELNGGDVAKNGIQIGDTVKHKLLQPKPAEMVEVEVEEVSQESPAPATEPTAVEQAQSKMLD